MAPRTKKVETTKPKTSSPVKMGKDLSGTFVVARSGRDNTILSSMLDDVERELDPTIYDKMDRDPTIYKARKILITSVLSDELACAPGATEAQVGEEEFQKYVWAMEFCERLIKGLETPIRDTMEQMFSNAFKQGHSISELEWVWREDIPNTHEKEKPVAEKRSGILAVWDMMFAKGTAEIEKPSHPASKNVMGQKALRLMVKRAKVKPRGTVNFLVDNYMNVIGFVPKIKSYTKLRWDTVLPVEKFMYLTMNKQNEDPRGVSSYRPAFTWYNLKRQIPTEMLRYILEEIVPKSVGTLPENIKDFIEERDDAGNTVYHDDGSTPKLITAAEAMGRQLEALRSGSGAVIPFGATLKPYKSGLTGSNDGNLFAKILKIINDEMENALLLQTLAQSEGEHQARSASQQVAEVLYNLIFWSRWLLAMMVTTHIFEPALRMNFGEWAVKYCPMVSLGDFVRRDWIKELEAIADAYFKGLIDDSQRPELMAWLNLPKPGPSRQEMTMEASAKQDINGEAVPNNDKRPDKQPGNDKRNDGNGTEKKVSAGGDGPAGRELGYYRERSGFFAKNLSPGT